MVEDRINRSQEARCCLGKIRVESKSVSYNYGRGGKVTFTELCRQYGISRKTGYKRVERYKFWGWEGLGDRSRAPHSHPNSTPQPVIERLIRAKGEHPTWGPKKLVAWLGSAEPRINWPASSTAGQILDRAGLVRRRKRRRHTAPWSEPFVAAERPNDVWSIDFKGWFRTTDGVRVDPLTMQDAFSRCLLVCQGLQRPRGSEVRAVCERAFREYGLPRAMRSDNGPPFASVGVGGLSSLSVWWIKLGIVPERIEPSTASGGSIMSTDHTKLLDNDLRPCSTHRRCGPIRRR